MSRTNYQFIDFRAQRRKPNPHACVARPKNDRKKDVNFVPKLDNFGVKQRFRHMSLLTLVCGPRPGLFCFSDVLRVLGRVWASPSLFSGFFWSSLGLAGPPWASQGGNERVGTFRGPAQRSTPKRRDLGWLVASSATGGKEEPQGAQTKL